MVAVYGHEELRAYLLVYPHRFLAVAVAGGMHVAGMVGDDVRALAGEIVFQLLHRALIAGDDRRREYDGIGGLQVYVLVGFVADACQRGEFVALCAGGENDELLRGILGDVLHSHHRLVFVLDEAELARYLYVGAHGAAVYHYALARFFGKFHHADEALQMRGEHRDDEPALGFFDYFLKSLVHVDLGDGPSRLPDIGAVHEKREHVSVLEDAKFALLLFARLSVYMREFDIAGEDDIAPRSLDDDAHAIRYGVRHAKEAYRSRSQLYHLILFYLAYDDRRGLKFLLAFLDHFAGETARVDMRIADAVHHIGNATDVVEVAVRYEESAYFIAALLQVAGVGENVIDARRIILGEGKAAIEYEYIVAEFYGRHVAAYLFHASERDDADGVFARRGDDALARFALSGGMMFHLGFAAATAWVRRSTE